METKTIKINGRFFLCSIRTFEQIESLVETLYGNCCEPFLSELNDLLRLVALNNPETDPVEGLPEFTLIF